MELLGLGVGFGIESGLDLGLKWVQKHCRKAILEVGNFVVRVFSR